VFTAGVSVLGFHGESTPYFGMGFQRIFVVPFWFPTLLLAALTWWTWRKPRSEGERGFAVEGADRVRDKSGEKSQLKRA
jgi:hypothetical protein